MKSFQQFVTEAREIHDREGLGSGTGMSHRGGDKLGQDRKKTSAEKKRVKAVGGGKTAPAKSYKPRKDIGTQRPKSRKEQQPTRERGSANLSAKESQRKAYLERKRKSAPKDEVSGKDKKIDLKREADKILTKKTTKAVSPKYKPQKASGYTANERRKIKRAGNRLLRDIEQKKEKPAAHYAPEVRRSQ